MSGIKTNPSYLSHIPAVSPTIRFGRFFCITSSRSIEASLPEPFLLNFVLTQQTHKWLIDEINMLTLRVFQNNSLANKFA